MAAGGTLGTLPHSELGRPGGGLRGEAAIGSKPVRESSTCPIASPSRSRPQGQKPILGQREVSLGDGRLPVLAAALGLISEIWACAPVILLEHLNSQLSQLQHP